jgi:hypothetical protein
MTRPDESTPWFSRSEEVNKRFHLEKREGRLIFDEFELAADKLSGTYTATWDTKESYQDFINSPPMLAFREERNNYNKLTGCTVLLISEFEV